MWLLIWLNCCIRWRIEVFWDWATAWLITAIFYGVRPAWTRTRIDPVLSTLLIKFLIMMTDSASFLPYFARNFLWVCVKFSPYFIITVESNDNYKLDITKTTQNLKRNLSLSHLIVWHVFIAPNFCKWLASESIKYPRRRFLYCYI